MTEQPSEQQSGECLSKQELDFLDAWRRLVDRAGGPAKVIRNLRWGKSTVYRNYGGQYLPSDEWVAQLCAHLQLPNQELVDLLGLVRRAREARQTRRAEVVQVARPASDKPASDEVEQRQPVAQNNTIGVAASGGGTGTTGDASLAGLPPSRRTSRRIVAVLVAVVVIAAPLGWWWYEAAHDSDTKCQSFGRAKFAVLIPVDCLSPTLSANVVQGPKTTNATVTGFVFANGADSSLCLSVNTVGSTAGENGDKVQLANCSFADEEIWIPVQRGNSERKFTWLLNYRYQSKCLNANIIGGLRDGHRVQLWNCYDASNEYWDFGDWSTSVDQGSSPTSIHLQSSNFCLDADRYDFGDGDQVNIWTAYGARNQLWS